MRLKLYQEQALTTLSAFLKLARDQRSEAEDYARYQRSKGRDSAVRDWLPQAWDEARDKGVAPAGLPEWRPMPDGAGRQVPHVCLKLPTGGGKTFLAGHAIERVQLEYLRSSTGLVLWIVPSQAIYAQTRAKLWDRGDPLRQVLERASGGRVKLLEKLDGLTAQDVADRLCIMLLMLQSTGRKDKETLRVFQDSGDYGSFFPEADDAPALARLLDEVPNLDLNDLASGTDVSIRQSMGNMLRIVRPAIVLDEGHKAYSETARDTVRKLNPSFLLELSATPKAAHSNILVNVSGRALKEEEMIKLPLELARYDKSDWKHVIETAVAELDGLQKLADGLRGDTGRYIRPILLVRVDRTGRDQRDQGFVHADDVFEHLTRKMGLSPDAVKRQTAEVKELAGDLLAETSGVRVVITKDALREGWDCPFAYSLAVLSPTTSGTALTQMVGRVLRQPHARRTGIDRLDRAYVYFQGQAMQDALAAVKKGLEEEGMGDLAGDLVARGAGGEPPKWTNSERRTEWKGKRLLIPQVLHSDGTGRYRELDYERDVLANIDWEALRYDSAETVQLAEFDIATRTDTAVDIATGDDRFEVEAVEPTLTRGLASETIERAQLIRLLLPIVPNPWQGARILDEALPKLRERYDEAALARSRLTLVEHMRVELAARVEAMAEAGFREKVEAGEIVFKLVGPPFGELNWALPEAAGAMIPAELDMPLLRASTAQPVQRSLLEPVVKGHLNGFERDVALHLDEMDEVGWWHRVAPRSGWGLQGWRRHKVYPDFLVWLEEDGRGPRLVALETKGGQLAGNQDTEWKRKLFEMLERAYAGGNDGGVVELGATAADSMRFRMIFQPADRSSAWKPELAAAVR